jgi:hypothetical protein
MRHTAHWGMRRSRNNPKYTLPPKQAIVNSRRTTLVARLAPRLTLMCCGAIWLFFVPAQLDPILVPLELPIAVSYPNSISTDFVVRADESYEMRFSLDFSKLPKEPIQQIRSDMRTPGRYLDSNPINWTWQIIDTTSGQVVARRDKDSGTGSSWDAIDFHESLPHLRAGHYVFNAEVLSGAPGHHQTAASARIMPSYALMNKSKIIGYQWSYMKPRLRSDVGKLAQTISEANYWLSWILMIYIVYWPLSALRGTASSKIQRSALAEVQISASKQS